jgi:hypothetical protein
LNPAAAVPSLLAGLTLGLAGSLHCLAMCGGIAASAGGVGHGAPARMGLLLNLGRIGGYLLLGGLVAGVAGTALDALAPDRSGWILRAAAAMILAATGLALMTGREGLGLERVGLRLWRLMAPLSAGLVRLPRGLSTLGLGALWGLLPCGLVYTAIALASTAGSAVGGAAVMLAFGLGTLPAMFAVSLAGRTLPGPHGKHRRLAGILMIGFAIWTLQAVLPGPSHDHGGHGDHAGQARTDPGR